MNHERPDPEEILRRIGDGRPRGSLRVFLGAAPGVGKTYAMLLAARARLAGGEPVLVGYVETHGRAETAALVEGLDLLPQKAIDYRGIRLSEFDIDAALARAPDTILIDELAHTNAPGCRHEKRWQDVEELLDRGINVWTTLNIQHIESLGDTVERIAGTVVREVVPDSILERADTIQVVDIAPEELVERLNAGKVYVPDTVAHALENFFRVDRLTALRELALRQAAQKVDAQLDDQGSGAPDAEFSAGERILVSVGSGPFSARLVRSAKIMAERLHARWFALSVETPGVSALPQADRDRINENLFLASSLGAEVHTLTGDRVSDTIISFAQKHRVTRIVIGKPLHSRLRDLLRGSLLDEVIRGSGDIDVLVITGEKNWTPPPASTNKKNRASWTSYLWATFIATMFTALNLALRPLFEMSDFALVYMLGVVLCSFRFGFGPSALAAILSVAAFDFLFVPPFGTLSVANPLHIVTFMVMLAVSFVVASLAQRARAQSRNAQLRERQTWMLFRFTEMLAQAGTIDDLSVRSVRHVEKYFKCRALLFVQQEGKLVPCPAGTETQLNQGNEVTVARWVFENGKPAGKGTGTLSGAIGTYYPVSSSTRTVAVLGLLLDDLSTLSDSDTRRLLDAHTLQLGVAIERFQLEAESLRRRLQVETETLRNALLSSVSHDLRTPLATIIGSATTQITLGENLPQANRDDLNQAILEEAERMNRLIGNLLDMTRLESGSLALKKELLPVEEVVGSTLARMGDRLSGHAVTVNMGDEQLFLRADSVLFEQLLVNLLDNAVKYTPEGSGIDISAVARGSDVVITVSDDGPGFFPGDIDRLFDRFYRGGNASGRPGSGLGLTICRGIAEAHGGAIHAENAEQGGARFVITIPGAGVPDLPDDGEGKERTDVTGDD